MIFNMIHRHVHENSQKLSFFLFKKISKPNLYVKNVFIIVASYLSSLSTWDWTCGPVQVPS